MSSDAAAEAIDPDSEENISSTIPAVDIHFGSEEGIPVTTAIAEAVSSSASGASGKKTASGSPKTGPGNLTDSGRGIINEVPEGVLDDALDEDPISGVSEWGVDGDGTAPPAVQVTNCVHRGCAAEQHQPAEQVLLRHREQDLKHSRVCGEKRGC